MGNKTAKRRKGIILGVLAVIIPITAFYAAAVGMIEYDRTVVLDGKVFFTGRMFGWNVFGMKGREGFLGARLLAWPGNAPDIMLAVHMGQDGYVISLNRDGVLLHTGNGTPKKAVLDVKEAGISNAGIASDGVKLTGIKDACAADLDGDGVSEILVLISSRPGEYADEMLILTLEYGDSKGIRIKELDRFKCGDLNPWKVQTADVDGDGIIEISLGVYKTAPFHPEMAKRPFLYNWTRENGMLPKWRGSRLSRPFDNYVFGDIESKGMDGIISIEATANGGKVLTSYLWKGFGFEKTAESDEYEDIWELQCSGREITAKIKDNDVTYRGVFIFSKGEIIRESIVRNRS